MHSKYVVVSVEMGPETDMYAQYVAVIHSL